MGSGLGWLMCIFMKVRSGSLRPLAFYLVTRTCLWGLSVISAEYDQEPAHCRTAVLSAHMAMCYE